MGSPGVFTEGKLKKRLGECFKVFNVFMFSLALFAYANGRFYKEQKGKPTHWTCYEHELNKFKKQQTTKKQKNTHLGIPGHWRQGIGRVEWIERIGGIEQGLE